MRKPLFLLPDLFKMLEHITQPAEYIRYCSYVKSPNYIKPQDPVFKEIYRDYIYNSFYISIMKAENLSTELEYVIDNCDSNELHSAFIDIKAAYKKILEMTDQVNVEKSIHIYNEYEIAKKETVDDNYMPALVYVDGLSDYYANLKSVRDSYIPIFDKFISLYDNNQIIPRKVIVLNDDFSYTIVAKALSEVKIRKDGDVEEDDIVRRINDRLNYFRLTKKKEASINSMATNLKRELIKHGLISPKTTLVQVRELFKQTEKPTKIHWTGRISALQCFVMRVSQICDNKGADIWKAARRYFLNSEQEIITPEDLSGRNLTYYNPEHKKIIFKIVQDMAYDLE